MKIYIIRHGETQGNKKALLQGRGSDTALNENGREQAEKAGEMLAEAGISFERVISSPLIRAMDTARIVSGCEPETDERLIEMDCGPYEGADLKNIPPELGYFFSDFVHHPAPEGMESLASMKERAADLLEDLKRSGGKGNILLSTHAIAMKGILEVLTPDSNGAYWSKFIGNCDVYVSELKEDGFTVPVPLGEGKKTVRVAAAVIRKDNRIFATQRGHGAYKGWWEFPGGKIEDGETGEQALVREIREELAVELEVGEHLMRVEYDYPEFHLSMDCFWCSIKSGTPTLLEHDAAKWLAADELRTVGWLPADLQVLERIENTLQQHDIS